MPSDTYTLIISDAGTTAAHKATHQLGGSDALGLDASQITAGTLAVGVGGTGTTTATGTGSVVRATGPTLVTPALGTPVSGVLTSCTGLPLTTGITGQLPIGNGGTGTTTGAPLTLNFSNLVASSGITGYLDVAHGGLGNSTGSATDLTNVNVSSPKSGSLLPATNGGTGFASYAVGNILYANSTTTLAAVDPTSSVGKVLISSGTVPSWGQASLTTGVTGILPVSNGGTGYGGTTYTTGDLLYANSSSTFAKRTIGTTGQVLTVTGGVPTWADPSIVTTVAANKGGTGWTGYAVGDILYADTTSTLAKLTAGSANKVLTAHTSGIPSWEYPIINGTVGVTSGGTGQTSITTGQLLCGGTTADTFDKIDTTTAGYVLTSNGSGNKPTWQVAGSFAGVLPIANGGTGFSSKSIGQLYMTTPIATTFANATDYTKLLSTTAVDTLTTNMSGNSVSNRLQNTSGTTRVYLVTAALTVTGHAADNIHLAIFKGGTIVNSYYFQEGQIPSGSGATLGLNEQVLVSLANNEFVELWVKNSDTGFASVIPTAFQLTAIAQA